MYQRDLAEVRDFERFGTVVRKILNDYPFEKLQEMFPEEVFKNAKRVILTGNGDSYCVSLAMRGMLQKMWKMTDIVAERCIEVGRYIYLEEEEDLSQTLVFVTSVSGTGVRVAEAMRRCSSRGCSTFAITKDPGSLIAVDAKYVMVETAMTTPMYDFVFSSQNFSYFNAMVNITLLALYGAVVRGKITREQESAMREELVRYVESFIPVMDDIDNQMYQLALKWNDTLVHDYVGTGVDLPAAYFGAAKGFEYSGCPNMYTDAEDWCHINFFIRNRENLATCVAASKGNPAFGRAVETVRAMVDSDSRVLVVTEEDASCFAEGVEVCKLPDTDVLEFKPLMNFIPFTLLEFHLARCNKLEFFISDKGDDYSAGPRFVRNDMNFIKTGKIEYIY